jgi:serine/threonine protein kinase/Flp pilus assembly protein TadD
MVGQTVSHYRVLEKLGQGGMGVVYKARDTHLDRFVALKVLPPERVSDPERKRRFVQEAKAASALNHPNIITIYDISSDRGVDFIAMEYVPGKTLDQLIGRKGLPVGEALKYAVQIADALARAHGAGIVHRDLKPSNIMVDEHGQVKVLDFGLAKLIETAPSGEDEPTRTIQAQTEEGSIVGTVAYMSPEQAQGLKVDARSDIFSFGAVLYEMLSGRRAFQGDTKLSTLTAILREEPKPLSDTVKGLPAELERIVTKALVKAPGDRYQHTDDLLVDLKGALKRLETVVPPQPQRTRPLKLWPALVAALALGLLVAGYYLFRERPSGRKTLSSIAVLPLENLSGDTAQEWFSDGMTESLIAELSKIKALKVISRTSVMRFKKTRKPLKDIARELDVEAIIEGSALLVKDRVRITAQLIEASTDRHLWAESYERDLRDVLSLQQQVAQAIAREIQVTLTPQEQTRLASARPVNPEVYTDCLKGRYYTMQYTQEGIQKGFEYLNQAIRMDPGFAPAFAWLASAYNIAADWYMPSMEAMLKANALALKAVELDEMVSEGHGALARVHMAYDWDWAGAEREFQRAIQLNPGDQWSRSGYGWLLFALKRFDESLKELRRAQELDPLSPAVNWNLGMGLHSARQYHRALEQLRTAIELDPSSFFGHALLGMTYEQQGELGKAIAEFRKARELNDIPWTRAYLGHGYAAAGDRVEALKIIAGLKEDSRRLVVAPYDVALVYAGLGEKDQALAWLEKAYQVRSYFLYWLQIDPRLDGLRSDPRFQDLLRRMNFPQ